jgi:hypothetical protein
MRRVAFIAAACATLCAAGPALARAPRHHQPLVSCALTICMTHFKVQIKGMQYTSWVVPQQDTGGGSCYETPWVRGEGEQSATFTGVGAVVEAFRLGHGDPTFEMLVPGHARPEGGIGLGTGSLNRDGTLVTGARGGSCGDNGVTPTEHYSGCGQTKENWVFDLAYETPDRVSLQGGTTAPTLSDPYANCTLFWTGSEAISGNETDLYGGFTVPLPAGELFNPAQNRIIVHGRYEVSDPPPANIQFSGVTGSTLVEWTVTFTRIAHAQFPVAQ